MHYKRKNLIIKSRDFVCRYLLTAWWRHGLDRLCEPALYVAVKQAIWRKFLKAEEVFCSLMLSSQHLLV